MAAPIQLSIDQRQLAKVGKALKEATDGKELRKFLIRDLKSAAKPLAADMKSTIRSAPARTDKGMRAAIAASLTPSVRLSGRNTGVSIRARKVTLRGFSGAPKAFNNPSFRHPVYGRGGWAVQVGAPNWFDGTVPKHREALRSAVLTSMESLAKTIAKQA